MLAYVVSLREPLLYNWIHLRSLTYSDDLHWIETFFKKFFEWYMIYSYFFYKSTSQ